MSAVGKHVYRFGDIELDSRLGCVKRNGKEQHLRQKAFHLLLYLIEQRQTLVTKEQLIESIWEGAAVTDDALVQLIKEVRRSLGDDSRQPRFIRTIPKVGYRFIGPVEELFFDRTETIETREVTTIEVEYEEEDNDETRRRGDTSTRQVISPRVVSISRRQRAVMIAALPTILILAIALGGFLWTQKGSQPEVTLPQVPGRKPIAVMYFENQSHTPELDWLREGLADILISDLSNSKQLTVLGRQQLHLLLDRIGHKNGEPVRLDEALDIARRSKAESVIMGSFEMVGGRLNIDAQLYDRRDGQLSTTERLTLESPEMILDQAGQLSVKLAVKLGVANEDQTGGVRLAGVITTNLAAYRLYSIATEKAQAYHTPEAIDLWQKAITLDPQFAMAYARIGYTYALIRVNEFERAKGFLEKALEFAQRLTDKDKLCVQAWYALANGDNPAGVRLLREVIAQYPLEIDAYLRLGYQLDYAGQLDAEIAVYKQALGVDPGAQDIYNALGFACSHLGRYDEAIAAHRRYVELAPAEPNAHDSLGLTYNEAGRYGEALAEFEVALSMDPAFHFANLHLGDVYFRLGRYRDAANEYEHYLHYAPSDWDSAQGYHRLTLLYLCTRELSRAKAAAGRELVHGIDLGSSLLVSLARSDTAGMGRLMEKLIDKSAKAGTLSPKQRIYYRGLYALKSGHALEAIDDFKEASRAAPIVWNIDGVEDCLANAYLELGRLDEAIIEYDRLLAINPNYPLAHFHLAQAYQQKGDIERARHEYETFLHIWKDADANIPEVAAAMQLTGSHSNQRSPTAPAL